MSVFGIKNLDDLVGVRDSDTAQGRFIAIIGEEGTYKSELGRNFLAQGLRGETDTDKGGVGVLVTFGARSNLVDRLAELAAKRGESTVTAESHQSYKNRLVLRRLSAQGVSAERFANLVLVNVLEGLLRCIDHDLASREELEGFCGSVRGRDQGNDIEGAVSVAHEERSVPTLVNLKKQARKTLYQLFPNCQVPWAKRVRVVIDDLSQFQSMYPDLSENRGLLAYLADVLKQVGVFTCIIDTQSGGPYEIVRSDLDRDLRSFIDTGVYTWNMKVSGESRTAITVIPCLTDRRRSPVRELRSAMQENIQGSVLWVDRSLELYSVQENSEPTLTPLTAFLLDEVGDQAEYLLGIAEVIRHATGHTLRPQSVIVNKVSDSFIRDMLLIRKASFSGQDTILVQIDNWWLSSGGPQEQNRKVGPPPHSDYMSEMRDQLLSLPESYRKRCNGSNDKDVIDSPLFGEDGTKGDDRLLPYYWTFGFMMLRHQAWLRGRNSDSLPGRLRSDCQAHRIDSLRGVGALLTIASRLKAAQHDPGVTSLKLQSPRYGTQHPIPWPDFFSACLTLHRLEVARGIKKPTSPVFGLASASGESLSCFVLEVWASIWDQLRAAQDCPPGCSQPVGGPDPTQGAAQANEGSPESVPKKGRRFEHAKLIVRLKRAAGEIGSQAGPHSGDSSVEWRGMGNMYGELEDAYFELLKDEALHLQAGKKLGRLMDTLRKFGLSGAIAEEGGDPLALPSLYLTLIHLAEVLDVEHLAEGGELEDSVSKDQNEAVACRHWYSTACKAGKEFSSSDPTVPFCMPGRYSIRGDWYLACLKESRSSYMAELASEAVLSRRSALERLRLGVGLPFQQFDKRPQETDRDPIWRGLQTAIPRPIEGRVGHVYYSELMEIAPLGYNQEMKEDSEGERETSPQWRPKPIWRSDIKGYSKEARIFRRWLVRTLIDFRQVLDARRGEWVQASHITMKVILSLESESPAKSLEKDWWTKVKVGNSQQMEIGSLESYFSWFKPLLGHLRQSYRESLPQDPD
jgi:KaiC/GvpD/RAD55 family RecA-like ATPase